MTDRELLELAAKAAGVKNWWDGDCSVRSVGSTYWNPFEDDGDALRLAVRLNMALTFSVDGTMHAEGTKDEYAFEHSQDNYASARRAIVRAAASIGEQMI